MEGIVGKRIDSPYRSGRSSASIKLKCSQRQELVIGGFSLRRKTEKGVRASLLGVFAYFGERDQRFLLNVISGSD
ncbi:hypothetical protein GR157_33555 [Burkholderia sp. 4701]|nr:hypothetical protein [Burkholderia sp. 4701]MXN86920.1 hypothetical protein [Burkholderia sp. 4812]